jgi:hypothetical protein
MTSTVNSTVTVILPLEARYFMDCLCPECGGRLRDANLDGILGQVICTTCSWSARWLRTTGELAGDDGPSQAVFEVTNS